MINLIFRCFRSDALTELGTFMRTEFLFISVLRVALEHRVKLASCKSTLTTPPPPPSPRRFILLTVLRRWSRCKSYSLILCGLFYERFVLCLTLCYFVLVFFDPFSTAITSLGEERANLSAFRTFVRFALVWFCLFPLPLGVWEGLRFVIVAFPVSGLFSYPLLTISFMACLCMYVLVIFLFWIAVLTIFWKETVLLTFCL